MAIKNTSIPIPLMQYGCAAKIVNGKLCSAPLTPSGDIEDNWQEVITPHSQTFLDTVNLIFGTTLTYKQFDGD